jgi:hypothetical protein
METTPTLREKDTRGGEEKYEEDKRKVKKLHSSFLPEREEGVRGLNERCTHV